MADYIIGCDAGGTKTLTTLYNAGGEALFTAKTGFGNLLVGAEAATGNIADGVAECLAHCGGRARIYVGASGIHAGDNRETVLGHLTARFPGCPARVLDDGLLAMYALNKGRDGMLVIAGTGSIAYGKFRGQTARAGGWGNVLGDEGSGYSIARAALANITREYDNGAPYSPLSRMLLEEIGCDFFAMVKFAHTAEKGRVAALLPVVERAAIGGDETAACLLAAAGADLANLARRLYRRMGCTGTVPVAVKGGVLEKTPAVYKAFAGGLDERFAPEQRSAPAELGAYYLYLEEKAAGEAKRHG